MNIRSFFLHFCVFLAAVAVFPVQAQTIDSTLFRDLHWRMIGPYRGGRTVGAEGIPDQPNVFYIGVNNGGVWRTSDFGHTWKPIFDDQPTGSIGALAVAPSNPNIIYVGSGEGLQRPDLSVGDGMFKSTDNGTSWNFLGLADAQQIGAVLVDPRNADVVFVAVLGHPYGPNEQRGVFKSIDGGTSWNKILYKDENTGAIALEFDPKNPDIVYASLWSARQGPWENGSWGGKTSGLFKSIDGGATWRQLTAGLPTVDDGFGRMGIAIAPNNPSRMYLIVDASKHSGLYRSDDAGEHWTLINTEERIYGRGDDFGEIKVHPNNENIVFVANTCSYHSTDGGKTFAAFKGAPGGDDYHRIWINPKNPDIMLFATDQGATITVNGGQSWSSWYNQPTAQLYHVITDNQFPYNVFGGQQESGSVGIVSRGNDGAITFREWHPVGADEWAYIAPDPLNPNIIYGGKVTKYNRLTGQLQNVAPEAIRSGKFRNLRTAPLLFSPTDPRALYFATNVLFKTTNGGQNWNMISTDLSREAPDVPSSIGIFRTPGMAKQDRRGVIYAVSISPLDGKIIWAGTDDGQIHISLDDGGHWNNITPASLTSWSKVAGIEAGHFDKKTAYAAVNRIRLDDMRPHIYRTHDGGTSWTEIAAGLPESGPVNVVREDPVRRGLLYAGTERAVYVSFDDGGTWLPLRTNMPATSIRDLVVHHSDLVVGTHGRSFWILDNVTPLRQLSTDALRSDAFLFAPDTAYRVRWNSYTDTPLPPEEPAGENPPDGAIIDYHLARDAQSVSIEIIDESRTIVRKYSSTDPDEQINEKELRIPTFWIRPLMRVQTVKGMHRFVWDLHYPPPVNTARSFPISAIIQNTASQPQGPWVTPGTYTVKLRADGTEYIRPIIVRLDPRIPATPEVLRQQHELSMTCYAGAQKLGETLAEIRGLREGLRTLSGSTPEKFLKDSISALDARLSALEGTGPAEDIDIVYFTVDGEKTVKETLGGLRTKMLYLTTLLQNAEARPTDAQVRAVNDEDHIFRAMMERWRSFRNTELSRFNEFLRQNHLRPLKLDEE